MQDISPDRSRRGIRSLWLTIGLGGAVFLPAGILWNPEPRMLLQDRMTTHVLLWPVSVLLALVAPGPKLGTGYEWTPVHDIAMAVGVGLSWLFWVSVGAGLWPAARSSSKRR
jgi:hypothetical protein